MDQSFVLAERTTRFIANMIDGFVFSLAILPCAAGIVILGESLAVGGTVFLVGLLPLGWFAKVQIRHARSGRSIGKAGQGIRVVRTDGSPAELWRIILLRNVVIGVIGNLVTGLSVLDSLLIFGKARRCLHDYLADTIVIADSGDGQV